MKSMFKEGQTLKIYDNTGDPLDKVTHIKILKVAEEENGQHMYTVLTDRPDERSISNYSFFEASVVEWDLETAIKLERIYVEEISESIFDYMNLEKFTKIANL